ncbi:MAG: LysM peptidoglycan-binding domain-containing protein [Candidatus Marinimicrobia bacterium]|nr:LysM peptidoglycan-binding domain-containing protein [Candidatus Neomarinimicrobiota bacterium]
MDMHAENFAGLKSNPMAVLDKSVVVIKNIDRVFDTIDSIMPKPFFDLYSVVKNDNLWRISGKEDIYSDPYQWMKIYSANRDQIKDANLIFPDQEFKIPRRLEDNQHEVAKGEHLTFVSESRYGNPFDWHKIYEANKNVIDDPNTVYPHTILTIP